ncbi:MAG: RsmE family RNA methyltransferase [Candidatus Wallbacteria bacterium]
MKIIKYSDLLAMDKLKFFHVSEIDIIGCNSDNNTEQCEYQAELNEYYSNYIVNVLKYKPGELFVLSDYNNKNYYYSCLISCKKKKAVLKLEPINVEFDAERNYTYVVAALKGRKEDELIEKLIELGINEISFFEGEHSIGRIETARLERYMRISESSAAQSRKLTPPGIRFKSLNNIINEAVNNDAVIFLLIEPSAVFKFRGRGDISSVGNTFESNCDIFEILKNMPKKPVVIISGPEGGFSESEMKYFNEMMIKYGNDRNSAVSNSGGFIMPAVRAENKPIIVPFTLKNVVLRAEVAPITAFAIIKYECGDF